MTRGPTGLQKSKVPPSGGIMYCTRESKEQPLRYWKTSSTTLTKPAAAACGFQRCGSREEKIQDCHSFPPWPVSAAPGTAGLGTSLPLPTWSLQAAPCLDLCLLFLQGQTAENGAPNKTRTLSSGFKTSACLTGNLSLHFTRLFGPKPETWIKNTGSTKVARHSLGQAQRQTQLPTKKELTWLFAIEGSGGEGPEDSQAPTLPFQGQRVGSTGISLLKHSVYYINKVYAFFSVLLFGKTNQRSLLAPR